LVGAFVWAQVQNRRTCFSVEAAKNPTCIIANPVCQKQPGFVYSIIKMQAKFKKNDFIQSCFFVAEIIPVIFVKLSQSITQQFRKIR
jgi:hypothetical protein